jgi:hypothetical protein
MKTNEAPEKIYISNFDIETLPKNEQLSERWHEVSTQDTDIEYTRTDAFIDKACEWLKEHGGGYWMDDYDLPTDELVKDFKNYMKGE